MKKVFFFLSILICFFTNTPISGQENTGTQNQKFIDALFITVQTKQTTKLLTPFLNKEMDLYYLTNTVLQKSPGKISKILILSYIDNIITE